MGLPDVSLDNTAPMSLFQRVVTMNGKLKGRALKKRRILVLYLAFANLFTFWPSLALIAAFAANETNGYLGHMGLALLCISNPLLLIYVLLGYEVSNFVLAMYAYVSGLGILMMDIVARGTKGAAWQDFILIVDFLLVMRVEQLYSVAVVVFVILWIGVTSLEGAIRFGLYDIPGTLTEEYRREQMNKFVDCATPPCGVDAARTSLQAIFALGVFVLDFVATRGFAQEVLTEQASMERTITTVQDIAMLLSRYDVDKVTSILTRSTDLPADMHAALCTLERNLRSYRPYLPSALFEQMHRGETEPEVMHNPLTPPPGIDTEVATIAFTDIRASTSIWESSPSGMREALGVHNTVIRSVIRQFNGYEVKTIGDAFMVAFAATQEGVNFALHVHERLIHATWPALLTEVPLCTQRGSLWGGLTVRIGVNSGPVTVEQNALTGRMDYFGHTVNVAARLESKCTPGALAIPYSIWMQDCDGRVAAVVGEPEALVYQGISDDILVCLVWPESLGGRRTSPLHHNMLSHSPETSTTASSLRRSASLETLLEVRTTTSTVGVIELVVGDIIGSNALRALSNGLELLNVSLTQSSGTLVTVVGGCVCVGWNLSIDSKAHAENALRFVQRFSWSAKKQLLGAGLVTGKIQHGDVGSRTQRFLTTVGPSVKRSWALCEEASRDGKLCLYAPPLGMTLPQAVRAFLQMTTGVAAGGIYELEITAKDVF